MKIALDTNVLAYVEGLDDIERREKALWTIRRLPQDDIVIPVQVLGELYNAALKKGRRTRLEAGEMLVRWSVAYETLETSEFDMVRAVDLAGEHRFQIWDSVIFSVAATAGCGLLLSEDMQDGFTWGGVTVADPFASRLHPLLAALLGS